MNKGRALAISCVIAGAVCMTVPDVWSEEEPQAPGPSSIVVVPFILDGRVDDVLTSAFIDQLSKKDTGWEMVEGSSVAEKLPKGEKFSSRVEVESLLKAADAAGAEAIIVGQARRYKMLDAPGIQLKVTLLDVESGDELYKKVSKASAWTSKRARREVAKTATKRLLKDIGRK